MWIPLYHNTAAFIVDRALTFEPRADLCVRYAEIGSSSRPTPDRPAQEREMLQKKTVAIVARLRAEIASGDGREEWRWAARIGAWLKFGGTSLGTAAALRKALDIAEAAARERPVVVVVSALSGVTTAPPGAPDSRHDRARSAPAGTAVAVSGPSSARLPPW